MSRGSGPVHAGNRKCKALKGPFQRGSICELCGVARLDGGEYELPVATEVSGRKRKLQNQRSYFYSSVFSSIYIFKCHISMYMRRDAQGLLRWRRLLLLTLLSF